MSMGCKDEVRRLRVLAVLDMAYTTGGCPSMIYTSWVCLYMASTVCMYALQPALGLHDNFFWL